jgi:hypothetical protein
VIRCAISASFGTLVTGTMNKDLQPAADRTPARLEAIKTDHRHINIPIHQRLHSAFFSFSSLPSRISIGPATQPTQKNMCSYDTFPSGTRHKASDCRQIWCSGSFEHVRPPHKSSGQNPSKPSPLKPNPQRAEQHLTTRSKK